MLGSMRLRSLLWIPCLALLVAALGGSLACGSKSKSNTPLAPILETVPAAWEGIWSVRTIVRVCNTTAAVLDSTIVDTLCAGGTISDVFANDLGFCDGAVVRGDDTRMSFSCSDVFDDPTCPGSFSLTLNSTVNPTNGTAVTTGRIAINFTPDTPSCPDLCLDVTQTATRLNPDPPTCVTAAHSLRRALASPAVRRLLDR